MDSIGTNTNFHTIRRAAVGSRITLTSPDPGATHSQSPGDTVHSDTEEVAFVPSEVDTGRKITNKNGTDQKVRGSVESIRIGDEL